MTERQELEALIKKTSVDKKEYKFDSKEEEERFVKNAAYYIESEYQEEGHYRYRTLRDFFFSSKADAILYGVANKDYNWFL